MTTKEMTSKAMKKAISEDNKLQELMSNIIDYSEKQGYLKTPVIAEFSKKWNRGFVEESTIIEDFSEEEKAFFEKVNNFIDNFKGDFRRAFRKSYYNAICSIYCVFQRNKNNIKIYKKDIISFCKSHFEVCFPGSIFGYELDKMQYIVEHLDFSQKTPIPMMNVSISFAKYCKKNSIQINYNCPQRLYRLKDMIYIIDIFF